MLYELANVPNIIKDTLGIKCHHNYYIWRYLNNCYQVHSGIFSGMKYLKTSYGSSLMPKLIGSYEQQIYPWLENLHKKYKQIYNIGCAEGYYAVGLAKKYPGIHIHACDISPVALDLCRELANLNSVTNISFHSRFVLPRKINSRLLIICDIEGDEYQLLDPYKHPYFKQCDLIVECHDFIKPNSSVLINRFRKTHQILLATDTHKVQSDYPYLKTFSPRIFQLMTDEGRPENGLFWVMLQMER